MAVAIQSLSCARFVTFGGNRSFPLQPKPLPFSITLSSNSPNLIVTASSKNKNKNKKQQQGNDEEEDAFELLFKQLEEDLKNDDGGDDDDDDDITEEEMALFEHELEGLLGELDDDDDDELSDSDSSETEADNDAEKTSADGNENSLKLRTWQLNKLARALKTGRRKISVKALAADVCLDRSLVLNLLRNPPPNLLMLSLSIPDEPTPSAIVPETTPGETLYKETSADHAESEPKSDLPIHTMQQNWSSRKRLKKAQLDTLERVYMRSKRPTNAMISSIVHVTNIPRKKVIKWFEDRRAEEGVPERRLPYQHSAHETG
ncbi:protein OVEREXPRESSOR OF CATIONIC PEROXIDASE 3-like isoform X3 [Trifolium pratense]|uniref:protein OVEREXPRESSOR OF CATIONIC PEROXIDASE 3-like isoform X3 n=1 Tax=Trifolium pratense TaxID=57577 RepID=UPI001E695947|nr:protein OVEREXPRESSOR OF CATIONIC PEROXIDASE 3-like isoform X3 [Trifolium pratense]